MKFDAPLQDDPFANATVAGKPQDRVDAVAKVTGTAPYAFERHDVAPNAVYGWIVGAAIAKGRISSIDAREAEVAPGVLAVVTHANAGPLGQAKTNAVPLLAGPDVVHRDQAVALVVATTLEQARDAAHRLKIRYARGRGGRYDLAAGRGSAKKPPPDEESGEDPDSSVGDFEGAFARATAKIDRTYTVPPQSHAMMEPYATTAAWEGSKLTLWTSNQMVAWAVRDTAATLKMDPKDVRIVSPYIGGGFGGKLWVRADAVLAALGARAVGRPVKVAMARPLMANNSVHRPGTIQRLRIAATPDGVIQAISHDTWSGNVEKGKPEEASKQTRVLYAGANRRTTQRLVTLDLPEGNAMRAPGEAPGMMALEVAMDELAETLRMDPVELRVRNDTQHDPEKGPQRAYSSRKLVECLRSGAERFGWSRRDPTPGRVRDGRWLVGMGMAAAFRPAPVQDSAARVAVDGQGRVTVETDMTDIGTGSYTILAQTAAELLGVPLERVTVRLGDSRFPVSAGSGGQWGAASSTAGVWAACTALRKTLAERAGIAPERAVFRDGRVGDGANAGAARPLGEVAGAGGASAEEKLAFGDLQKTFVVATFGAHFCEVGVDAATGEVRIRRQQGTFAAGRILNPKAARNQIIGSMTMGVGAALMEECVVDGRLGHFVNHDLAEYHVPVHADIPEQDIVFLDEVDGKASPLGAKGVGELGICGAPAAVANAVYNATGVRVREFPITLDKLMTGMRERRA
jgi:xanthine dehydrogenase YagR molybdenum-binding subunit